MSMGSPMARYAAAQRVGDFVFMSGVVAVDPATRQAVSSYEQLPEAARTELGRLGFCTGQMSVDVFEAPIVAQSWFVLERIRALAAEHGGSMADVFKLVQYFRRLPDYAPFNRVRGLFYPDAPPVSTVLEVNRFLPGDEVLIEVEATMYLPRTASR
ncbi:RidA family protein [Xenophilus arseniciresistens]|uniref:RidA family protein n=1 Tax=Xenophilus arseniciresistens TaxID=1283306 RepID=A0AAE3NAU7_9BURK|nr:RidA family protein [Xenophilus arseniciresistens]MDA7416907.1 RidA family protein [Xenophilus arseniciresistens]